MYKAAVVDLDGTYIKGNTLKIYLFSGLKYCVRHFYLAKFSKLLFLIAKRRFKIISHSEMKSGVLSILSNYDEITENFSIAAKKQINVAVNRLINDLQHSGYNILLATAAPDFYVKTIWAGDYVATEFNNSNPMIECRGMKKLSRVNDWMNSHDCKFDIVISDHLDDAPLFEANENGKNILVNPNRETLCFFRKLQPTHFLLIEEIDNIGISR